MSVGKAQRTLVVAEAVAMYFTRSWRRRRDGLSQSVYRASSRTSKSGQGSPASANVRENELHACEVSADNGHWTARRGEARVRHGGCPCYNRHVPENPYESPPATSPPPDAPRRSRIERFGKFLAIAGAIFMVAVFIFADWSDHAPGGIGGLFMKAFATFAGALASAIGVLILIVSGVVKKLGAFREKSRQERQSRL
jgi:hypothetical protein